MKEERAEKPVLYIVVPCYNEEAVLPITSGLFQDEISHLAERELISNDSKVVFVNDGSKDSTWQIICDLASENACFEGICLSRNRGHQNALLAGLMYVREKCDITISIDCDGQDDIHAMDEMVEKYLSGYDVVYGVRKKRETDTFFKRFTAEMFYHLLRTMGVEAVFNHADYRLLSSKVLKGLSEFKEVNLFLRGMIPLVGYRSISVYYDRAKRMAGESHYPLRKMLQLAFDGITSLSIKPIRIITLFGVLTALLGFAGIAWAIIQNIQGSTVSGWASTICIVLFMGGIQLICTGVIGEYIGKIYLETKGRPRYLIAESTFADEPTE